MWQLFLERLMNGVQRQVVKQGVRGVGLGLIGGLSKPEAYVDRINREFNLRDYAKAWNLYDSNRAYWEKLYGDDPLTSLDHPASPPMSLLPRQPDAQSLVPSPIGSTRPTLSTTISPNGAWEYASEISGARPCSTLARQQCLSPGQTQFRFPANRRHSTNASRRLHRWHQMALRPMTWSGFGGSG